MGKGREALEVTGEVMAAILLGLAKVVKVVFLAFAWVIIIGCAITKNR